MPHNLYIIGTMNTSDRSIALVDAALRRRFAFIRMWPDYKILNSKKIDGIKLGDLLKKINTKLQEQLGSEAYDLLIGHSYFMDDGKPIEDIDALKIKFETEIIPLIEEYFRGDIDMVKEILGNMINEDGSFNDNDFKDALYHIIGKNNAEQYTEENSLDEVGDDTEQS